MFIRWTLPNGTVMWYRADHILSVQKHAENKIQTIVLCQAADSRGQPIFAVEEEQVDIVDAVCSAMKTGIPQITKRDAPESPPGRLIS